MKIHISQYTRECLPSSYKIADRGEIQIKGKGKWQFIHVYPFGINLMVPKWQLIDKKLN